MSPLLIFLYSTSITFSSMLLGIAINGFLKKKAFYKNLSNFHFIKDDLFYKILGINMIRWLVSKTYWKYANPHFIIKKRPGVAELLAMRSEMTNAEISHLAGFVIVGVVSVFLLINQKLEFSIILTIMNILFNLYPALLQQKNKSRISQFLKSI